MPWLVVSIVASIILTVLLNVGMRAFPGTGRRLARNVNEPSRPSTARPHGGRRTRVWVPWRAMIIGSVALTVW